jgi:putative PEP-CTERM system histidine kinase
MMAFPSIISLIACLFCFGLAFLTLIRNRRSFIHWTFAIGMIALGLEAGFLSLSLRSSSEFQMLYWQRLRIGAASILPGIWLVFTLSYGREESYKEFLRRQKWIVLGIFFLPIILSTLFRESFFKGGPVLDQYGSWLLRLGWSGYVFFVVFLLAGVLILMNLEKTFRASTGAIRWQIKFILLGLGSLFAVRIYTGSQTLLYSTLNPLLSAFNAGALIVATLLILVSLLRSRQFNVNIYLSQTFLYNSLIVLIVGIYLISVGILAKAIQYLDSGQGLFFKSLLIFLLLLGLTIFILSEEVRHRLRVFVSRHFGLPEYDYRREWREFTKRTTSLVDIHQLSSAVVKMVAETFGVSSASIWLFNEMEGDFALSGSTLLSRIQARRLKLPAESRQEVISEIRGQSKPIDFSRSEVRWVSEFKKANPEYFEEDRIICCIPLAINENFLGLLTLNHRMTGKPFSQEDFDLLKTLADQAAGSLFNIRLYEHFRQAKEIEAFQTMSAYIMHDLKNLASTLSMTLQNLPIHHDNPEFRRDALRMMQQGVTKVNNLCSHLSMLSEKIELNPIETDLNELVDTSFSCLNGTGGLSFAKDFQLLPRLLIDPEQIQKVLTNLILNAKEAISMDGEIRVSTSPRDGWAMVSVSDNGCGMSKEFIEQSLFRPFKTTKKQGMGIGLFQSKMIVEAHNGRIEVESEEGRGTTFRVFLPLNKV